VALGLLVEQIVLASRQAEIEDVLFDAETRRCETLSDQRVKRVADPTEIKLFHPYGRLIPTIGALVHIRTIGEHEPDQESLMNITLLAAQMLRLPRSMLHGAFVRCRCPQS
jgi:hypothetical protein